MAGTITITQPLDDELEVLCVFNDTGTVEAGTNDANELLILNDDILAESGTQTLYTCFGEAVQLNVQNVPGDCALINGVDFIQFKGTKYFSF